MSLTRWFQGPRTRLARYVIAPVLGAAILGAAALLVGGGALAAGRAPNRPVSVVTLTGSGSTYDAETFPNVGQEYSIPLNGESTFSFTQPAGAAVELIATQTGGEAHWSNSEYPAAWCEATVYVYDDAAPLGVMLQLPDQRGDHVGYPGFRTAANGLAAPDSDQTVTLHAIIRENGDENGGCDAAHLPDEPTADDDWWTVSLRISVVTMQS